MSQINHKSLTASVGRRDHLCGPGATGLTVTGTTSERLSGFNEIGVREVTVAAVKVFAMTADNR